MGRKVVKKECARAFPRWYHTYALLEKDQGSLNPSDFDEELSMEEHPPTCNEEDSSDEFYDNSGCACNGDLFHPYTIDPSFTCDNLDVDHYDKIDDMREERIEQREEKRKEKQRENARERQEQIEKDRQRRLEDVVLSRNKQKEVGDVYQALKAAVPRINIRGHFELYSEEYTKRFDPWESPYVEFYSLEVPGHPRPTSGEKEMDGHIYLSSECGCGFQRFVPPTRASVDRYRLKSVYGGHKVTFQFISDDHIKLKVGAGLLTERDTPPPDHDSALDNLPEFFEFVGVRRHNEESERRKRKREEDKEEQGPRAKR